MSEDNELLDIELDFESMDDFSPGSLARRIPQMEKLLEARTHLAELITYMDGKTSAEEVVKQLLEQPDFYKILRPMHRELFRSSARIMMF